MKYLRIHWWSFATRSKSEKLFLAQMTKEYLNILQLTHDSDFPCHEYKFQLFLRDYEGWMTHSMENLSTLMWWTCVPKLQMATPPKFCCRSYLKDITKFLLHREFCSFRLFWKVENHSVNNNWLWVMLIVENILTIITKFLQWFLLVEQNLQIVTIKGIVQKNNTHNSINNSSIIIRCSFDKLWSILYHEVTQTRILLWRLKSYWKLR